MTTSVATPETPRTSPTRRRPLWTVPAILVAVALLALLAYGLRLRGQTQVDRGPAPAFAFQTFDGQPISLADLKGKPVVLNFWASWCKPCEEEAAFLENAARTHPDVVFLGLAHVDTEPDARAYLQRFGISYPNGPDLGGRIADDYRVRGVPETFFIAADGNVQSVKIGPLQSAAELDTFLAGIAP